MLSERQQQQQQSFNDIYTTLILEEAEKIYNKLITNLTNSAIAATAARVSLPLSGNNNNQELTYKNHRYERGELRYNNQPEIYNNDQEKPK